MHRRSFLSAAFALGLGIAAAPVLALKTPPNRTQWKVRSSEGFDAIAFLGPLSGRELYTKHYGEEAAQFGSRLESAVLEDIGALWQSAEKLEFGLLGPSLAVIFSAGGNDKSLDSLLNAIDRRSALLLPAYKASPYWSEADWQWFDGAAPRLKTIFAAMKQAGFASFRAEGMAGLDARVDEVQRSLGSYDVISLQEKLTGRRFDPTIEIVLLRFAKPHGIKVQGQTFLQAADYDTATTVRIAAHEMLHPPVDMDGPAARAALAVLARDPLMTRIVRDHDPRWGYTTLEGVLNEDLCQALDQLISEALGVARNPADRWRKSDDGMHVLAGALYGFLRQDRWTETGGSIESWLAAAAKSGRLSPAQLHPMAARVLERPVTKLWPLT